ncbi:Fungalysin metallopeptidase-domain-containing protein [Pilobolus umbonatus]|nr:Fungalysin metallopeptidase-domain-containing protein [Pilobolus umbonatus]
MKYSITSAVLLLLGASTTLAATLPYSLNPDRLYQQGLSRSFGPELNREYASVDTQFATFSDENPEEIAMAFARSELTSSNFDVLSAYQTDLNGVTHVHLRQKVNGLQVFNGDINVNVDRHGRVISYGNSFAEGYAQTQGILKSVKNGFSSIAQIVVPQTTFTITEPSYTILNQAAPVIDPAEAVLSLLAFVKQSLPDPTIVNTLDPNVFTIKSSFEDDRIEFSNVPFALSPVEARQGYVQLETGELQLVWDLQLELKDNWYNSHINAHDGTVVSLIDWVSSATLYNVVPFGYNDPSDSLQQMVKNPHDKWASPDGWHAQGTQLKGWKSYNVTIGNNAYTHTNPDGGSEWQKNHRPKGEVNEDGDLVFDFQVDFDTQEPKDYEDAAVTNLFYWCNTAHDFFYRFGFDEKSGNFQQDNLGRGRKNDDGAGDAVIANAQDGSGRNNANFATPPDGKHGKMRMYVWDQTKPMRDGDFESGIVIHEYTHGVSIRLTGGPKNSNCLGWGEAGGMGEGWGDFIATVIRMHKDSKNTIEFGMGDYSNGGEGIRKYKYSTSLKTNPSTYRIMDKFDYWGVHAKGEVWAEMLYEVYWSLVDELGFTPEWLPPVPKDTRKKRMSTEDLEKVKDHIVSYGNTLAVQLVIDGMKLQPCNPNFVSARDAILEAEKQLTGGKYHCVIYRAFAKRGLGPGAKLQKKGWMEQRVESFSLPSSCDED